MLCTISAFDRWYTGAQEAEATYRKLVGSIARIWTLLICLYKYFFVHSVGISITLHLI